MEIDTEPLPIIELVLSGTNPDDGSFNDTPVAHATIRPGEVDGNFRPQRDFSFRFDEYDFTTDMARCSFLATSVRHPKGH